MSGNSSVVYDYEITQELDSDDFDADEDVHLYLYDY